MPKLLPKPKVFSTQPLESSQAELFYGYGSQVDRLQSELSQGGSVGVSGSSGSGKTSLMIKASHGITSKSRVIHVSLSEANVQSSLNDIWECFALQKLGQGRGLSGPPSWPKILRIIQGMVRSKGKPPVLILDDLDKLSQNMGLGPSRVNSILQFLLKLRKVLEFPGLSSCVALPQEFVAQVRRVLIRAEGAPVLGCLRHVVVLPGLSPQELMDLVQARMGRGKGAPKIAKVMEPEALKLSLSLSQGNPRKILYIFSEATYQAAAQGRDNIMFNHVFDVIKVSSDLDEAYKRILFYMCKSSLIQSSDANAQAFSHLDRIALKRRLEMLAKKDLIQPETSADGTEKSYKLKYLSALPSHPGDL